MARKIALWALPIAAIALIVAQVVFRPWQTPSETGATLSDAMANGGYWFVPVVLLGIWLGILIGATRGVLLGAGLGLLTVATTRVALPAIPSAFMFHWLNPPILITLGGILGGILGGFLDRPRRTAAYWSDSLSVRFALAGAGLGFVLGICNLVTPSLRA